MLEEHINEATDKTINYTKEISIEEKNILAEKELFRTFQVYEDFLQPYKYFCISVKHGASIDHGFDSQGKQELTMCSRNAM